MLLILPKPIYSLLILPLPLPQLANKLIIRPQLIKAVLHGILEENFGNEGEDKGGLEELRAGINSEQ